MKYLKNLGITLGIIILYCFICNLVITTLNYFNILNNTSIFKILIIVTSYLIGGLLMSKKCIKKGWLEGLKFGLIFSFILIILNLLLKNSFNFNLIFYYFILILSSTIGGIIGIKKN